MTLAEAVREAVKHLGPGDHPSGTPQSAHGVEGGDERIDQDHIPAKLTTGRPLEAHVFRGTSTGANESEFTWSTTDRAEAQRYAAAAVGRAGGTVVVTENVVTLRNPFVTSSMVEMLNAGPGTVERLRAAGHDGMAYRHSGGIPLPKNPHPTPRVWLFQFPPPNKDGVATTAALLTEHLSRLARTEVSV